MSELGFSRLYRRFVRRDGRLYRVQVDGEGRAALLDLETGACSPGLSGIELLPEEEQRALQEEYKDLRPASSPLEALRLDPVLDASRDPEYPDRVMVLLVKQGEASCPVKTELLGTAPSAIRGRTLEDSPLLPAGEEIFFHMQEVERGLYMALCPLDRPQLESRREIYEKGLLEEAVEDFYRTEGKAEFTRVLLMLRDALLFAQAEDAPLLKAEGKLFFPLWSREAPGRDALSYPDALERMPERAEYLVLNPDGRSFIIPAGLARELLMVAGLFDEEA